MGCAEDTAQGMTAHHLLLLVGANRRNLELLAQLLGKEGYGIIAAASLQECDQALTGSQAISLALVDIGGFDRSIWERCERLRQQDIPLFVLSPKHSATIQQASLAHGARGVLVKPLIAKQLIALIHTLLEGDA